jgi:hypothetical protein
MHLHLIKTSIKEIKRLADLFKVITTLSVISLSPGIANAQDATPTPKPLPALTIKGENYVDAKGQPVRFWGINLVALYPEHVQADTLAADLASLQINLVRPHHLLRPSKDWAPDMTSGALVLYNKDTSREFDPVALDRFDYLMAALRKNGIYIALSTHFTRQFRVDDVDILKTDDADRRAWRDAMADVNTMTDWRYVMDVYKLLPVIDERAALLSEEFIKNLLTHVNPYTGVAYGSDTQMISLEVLNETSLEYWIVCQGKFPDYWQAKFMEKWKAFAAANGIEPGDFYKPADDKAKEVRGKFLRQLDENYFKRMKAAVRSIKCDVPMAFTNLWRGDNPLAIEAQNADFIENHSYMDPLVVRGKDDGFGELTKSAIAGKPFLIGEYNQAEGEKNIKAQSAFRTMLMPAVSAYGCFQNWTAVEWFAWVHGSGSLDKNGRAVADKRESSIGNMITDGMMIDHLRTAGIIFRKQLVAPSTEPIILKVEDPYVTTNYHALMNGRLQYQPGWQAIHAIRKEFVPAGQGSPATEPWLNKPADNPMISDTKQIIKDIDRKQLTVAAPQAEAFSGYLDGKEPAGLKHLAVSGCNFTTVIMVANDDKNLSDSEHLIISRTGLDKDNKEVSGPDIKLSGLKKAIDGKKWYLEPTRPSKTAALPLALTPDGTLTLPSTEWHECELRLR